MNNYIMVEFKDTTGKVANKLLKSIIETLEANDGTLLSYERKDDVPKEVKVIGSLRGI